jgi:hypothetical protein
VIRAIECGKVAPALLLYVPAGLPYEEWTGDDAPTHTLSPLTR